MLRTAAIANGGFTLTELLITVALISILAAVALPAYNDSVRKSRRSDAMSALATLQQAQERWRSNHSSYSTDMTSAGLNVPTASASGYYGIAITSAGSSDYELTATATAGKSQSKDEGCQIIAVKLAAGNEVKYGSGTSSVNWSVTPPDPKRCWGR